MDRRDFIKESLTTVAAMGATTAMAGIPGMSKVLEASESEKNMNNQNAKAMKVLLINGSPRKDGNTATALQEAAKQFAADGIETDIVNIGNKPIRGCIACGQCGAKKLGKCVFDDDICNQIIEKAAEADGFIFGAPTYYGIPNGALLAIIQRMLYSAGKHFMYKPYACVAACRRGGGSTTFTTLNLPFQMMCMPQVNGRYWNIAYGAMPGETDEDKEGMQNMRVVAQNMAWLLKNPQPHPDYPSEIEWTNFIR